MSVQTTSVQDGEFVGSSHVLELGDQVITDAGGSFGTWSMEVVDAFEGADGNDWFKIRGAWNGARCYDLYYDWSESAWFQITDGRERVRVYKV